MWQWLLILTIAVSTIQLGYCEISATSVGSTSDSEAAILWKDGKAAFDAGNHLTSANSFQRLVDRYPGYPGYLDAHLMLGRSRLELGQSEKALIPLQYYVKATQNQATLPARLLLGRVYINLKHYNEAYLTSLEVEKITTQSEIQAEALLIRTHALIGLGRDARAERSLSSARGLLSAGSAEADWLTLKLKTRACAQLPSKGPLDERQTRDQMDRRGTCFLEGLLLYRKALEANDVVWAGRAENEMEKALLDYSKACSNPPAPPANLKGSRKHRTPLELKRYRVELALLLEGDCKQKLSTALSQIKTWREDSKLPNTSLAHVDRLVEKLTHQLSR